MEELTVLIKLKTEEQLTVPKDLLISNSPVFKHLFVDLKFDEHVIDDFSPDSVKHFLTVLENKSSGDIEDKMFRELHKLGTAFEVDWLKESCRDLLKKKMESASSQEDKIYLFEECWFIADKLKDEDAINDLVSVLAHKNNSLLLSHYLSDMSKVKEAQIDVLLKLGGGDVELFLNIILQNLRGQKTLDSKVRYILDNMNLAACSEINDELYLEVMDTVSELQEISANDLKWAYKLITNTVRAVRSRKEEKKERTTEQYDRRKYLRLIKNCKTVTEITKAVFEDRVTSMFVVIELLLNVFFYNTTTNEEQQVFIKTLTEACTNKQLQKVSRHYLHNVISSLKYSNKEQSKPLITLLTEIEKSKEMSTNNENVIIKRHEEITVTEDEEYKDLFMFKHPLSVACTKSDSKCGFIKSAYQIRLSNPLITLLTYFSDKSYVSFFKTLNRRNSRILTAFLDNRAPLKGFLYKIGKVRSPSCTYCNNGLQDNIHILLHCPALSYDRLSQLGPSPHIVPGTNANKDLVTPLGLLKFLLNIPLFTDFSDS